MHTRIRLFPFNFSPRGSNVELTRDWLHPSYNELLQAGTYCPTEIIGRNFHWRLAHTQVIQLSLIKEIHRNALHTASASSVEMKCSARSRGSLRVRTQGTKSGRKTIIKSQRDHNNLREVSSAVQDNAWHRFLRKTKTSSPKANVQRRCPIQGGGPWVHRGAISCSNNLGRSLVLVHRGGVIVWRERARQRMEEGRRRLLSYVSRCTGLFA